MTEFKMGPLQKKWIARLKKHPERHQIGYLATKENKGKEYKACCLGEACIMLKIGYWQDNELYDGGMKSVMTSYHKIGLRSRNGMIACEPESSLADLNDDGYHGWLDIAYLIEAAPELFFTEPK